MEAVFARGDRRVGRALEKAFRLGCKFDGWSEHLRYDLWEKAFDDTGIDMDFYAFRERGYDELLPWDIIDPLIDKEFLVRENEKAKNAQVTPDCRLGCERCGINKYAECFSEAEKGNANV